MTTAKKPEEMTRAELLDEVERLRERVSASPPRPHHDRHVSLRALAVVPLALDRFGGSLAQVLEGTSVTAEGVRSGHGYVDWETCVGIFDAIDARVASDESWRALGREVLDVPLVRGMAMVVGLFTDVVDLYRLIGQAFGPGGSVVPFLELEVRPVARARIVAELRAPEGESIPRGMYLPLASVLEQAPTLAGQPPAAVEVAVGETGTIRYGVTLQRAASRVSAARKLLRAGVRHIAADELREAHDWLYWQNRDLAERLRELERSEERRRELEALLRDSEKMNAIGRLAGAIAHDFNNHLTVILTHAELMAEVDVPARTAIHVDEVLQSAERARNLVRQLTTFSRRQPLRVEVVEPGDLLRGMARMLHTIVGERVRLHVTVESHPLFVRIDPTHFEQIVVNLVANARDALPDGGTIWVRLAETKEGSRSLEPGPSVELTVRDDGTGMSEETRLRAFEPFFTTKPRGIGTGIGLATVYALTRQHDGVAHIQSSLGNGTSVRLVFPRAQSRASGQRPAENAKPEPATRATILVVEDQPSIRRLLCRLLERDGHAVLLASSAEEALGIAELHDFDLLLTDVVMPGASGPELAARLRSTRPRLPVLFTSGADEDRGLDERSAFVHKPFKVDQLRQAVQDLLRRERGEQAS